MMKVNKLTKAAKIMRYIASNPTAKAREVAKALKVSVDSVYQATYLAKKGAKSNLSSVPSKRGRPSRVKTFFATSNKSIKADAVNHPPHYKVGGIETIDFIEAKSLSYNLGNVVKYITRADHKGNKLEDLKKAQWYLNREVQTMEKSK
jgi:predicted ArsR family transcriptional regulator